VFNNSVKNSFKEVNNNRFKDFVIEKIISTYHGAFLVEKKIQFLIINSTTAS